MSPPGVGSFDVDALLRNPTRAGKSYGGSERHGEASLLDTDDRRCTDVVTQANTCSNCPPAALDNDHTGLPED